MTRMLKRLFIKPAIIGLVANANEGKSNVLYYFIEELKDKASIYAFGLKKNVKGVKAFHSIKELEQIQNSLIIIDEFKSLFDVENRKKRLEIEQVLRLIYHNNNIVVLSGLPDNFKKFISSACDMILFKKVYYDAMVNGSKAKRVLMDFNDVCNIKGSTQLNLSKDKVLVFDGLSYTVESIPYIKGYDTKKDNVTIVDWKQNT